MGMYGHPKEIGVLPWSEIPSMGAFPFPAQSPVATGLFAGYGQQPPAQGQGLYEQYHAYNILHYYYI